MGVDGSPLHVLGQVAVELQFGKKHFPTDVVVAETLSAEAILVLDFLVQMHAVIDLAKQKIVLPEGGGELSLEKVGSLVTTPCFPVCIPERIEVPPTSEVEVMATVVGDLHQDSPQLFEGSQKNRLPVMVARAIVKPEKGKFPIHLINPNSEPAKVYPRTTLGTLEQFYTVLSDMVVAGTDITTEPGATSPVAELLDQIVERNCSELSGDEKGKFIYD